MTSSDPLSYLITLNPGNLSYLSVSTGNPNSTNNSTNGGCSNAAWIGDGYCDDVTNNIQCNYDGGDCCGVNINTNFCIQCQCLSGGGNTTTTSGGSTTTGASTTLFEGIIIDNYKMLFFLIANLQHHPKM